MKLKMCLLIAAMFCLFMTNAQSYQKVKINLKNGSVIDGKKALMNQCRLVKKNVCIA